MLKFRGLLRPAIAVGGICGVIHAAALFLLVSTTETMSVMLWSPGPFLVLLLILSLVFCALSIGGTYLAAALGIPLPIPTVVLSAAFAALLSQPIWSARGDPIKMDIDGLPVCAQAGGIEFRCDNPMDGILWAVFLVLACGVIALTIFNIHAARRRDSRPD